MKNEDKVGTVYKTKNCSFVNCPNFDIFKKISNNPAPLVSKISLTNHFTKSIEIFLKTNFL